MVYRVRKQLVEESFRGCVKPQATSDAGGCADSMAGEAKLIALACSKPPKGRVRWTLRLLENKVVELGIVGSRQQLNNRTRIKKTLSSPIADSSGSFRRRRTARS